MESTSAEAEERKTHESNESRTDFVRRDEVCITMATVHILSLDTVVRGCLSVS